MFIENKHTTKLNTVEKLISTDLVYFFELMMLLFQNSQSSSVTIIVL